MASLESFTKDTGRMILRDIIKTINQPDNTLKIQEVKAAAGKEMIMVIWYFVWY